MPITTTWRSARPGTEVYHNNSGCTEENNIEAYNVREGTGNLRLCKHCERLNTQEMIQLRGIGIGLLGGPSSLFNFAVNQRKK
jgi:hypothetical protein